MSTITHTPEKGPTPCAQCHHLPSRRGCPAPYHETSLATCYCACHDLADLAPETAAERDRLREALRELIAAEEAFERESGVRLDDRVSDAVKAARAALAKAEGREDAGRAGGKA